MELIILFAPSAVLCAVIVMAVWEDRAPRRRASWTGLPMRQGRLKREIRGDPPRGFAPGPRAPAERRRSGPAGSGRTAARPDGTGIEPSGDPRTQAIEPAPRRSSTASRDG